MSRYGWTTDLKDVAENLESVLWDMNNCLEDSVTQADCDMIQQWIDPITCVKEEMNTFVKEYRDSLDEAVLRKARLEDVVAGINKLSDERFVEVVNDYIRLNDFTGNGPYIYLNQQKFLNACLKGLSPCRILEKTGKGAHYRCEDTWFFCGNTLESNNNPRLLVKSLDEDMVGHIAFAYLNYSLSEELDKKLIAYMG